MFALNCEKVNILHVYRKGGSISFTFSQVIRFNNNQVWEGLGQIRSSPLGSRLIFAIIKNAGPS